MQHTLTRRTVVGGLAAGLPLAAVLADSRLARAAASALEPVTITTAGGRSVSAALARPAAAQAPAVVLIHEWWGLNDQIKAVAADLARSGYLALAVDLYDGKSATDRDSAAALMKAVDSAQATETLVSWIRWLQADRQATGKVATMGWCFGGGWSLQASTATPVDATVIYYGRVNLPADQLARLKGPVLGHFAQHDDFINAEMVGEFERAIASLGKPLTVYWYDAQHAFANPTGARYDAADAALAWERTQAFLAAHLA
jgi:carboxymethylenebutenolidase